MSDARIRREKHMKSSIFGDEPTNTTRNARREGRTYSDFGSEKYSRNSKGNDLDYQDAYQPRPNRNIDSRSSNRNSLNYDYEDSNPRTNRPSDTQHLLGNDKSNYYGRQNIRKVPDFEPKYQETSAKSRKYADLYGETSSQPSRTDENYSNNRPELSSRQRKQENNESTIFYQSQYRNVTPELTRDTQSSQFSPELRRTEMQESSIFYKQDHKNVPRSPIESWDEEPRRKNQNYSDLFGAPTESQTNRKPEKLMASTTKWTENDARTYTREEDFDVQKFKSKNLWGSEDVPKHPIQKTEKSYPYEQSPQGYKE